VSPFAEYPWPVLGSTDGVRLPRRGLRLPDPAPDPASNPDGRAEFGRLASIARLAEASGFDSVWVTDHPGAVPSELDGFESLFEAYSLLGALATRTDSVGLGMIPRGPTVRSPSMVAKIVTGVDVVSHGRAVLSLGLDAGGGPDAVDRLGEELEVCRALLTQDTPSFDGRFYHLDHAPNRPRPVRSGGIPLLVVADDPAVAEPVARGADAVVMGGEAAEVGAMVAALDQECEPAGRDRGEVGVIWIGAVDGGADRLSGHLRALAEIGATGCVVSVEDGYDAAAVAAAGKALSAVAFGER
jgi:alkanesulfonate monooxygenase SsuD/methylene tetrahydromethanopterin reductase-like flavin-dependent oxidoreductase (luciferase family)